jgi:DNA polymerase-4
VGDIAHISLRTLQRAVGDALGSHLHDLAKGIDDRPVRPYELPKSVGSEETYSRDLDSVDEIFREVLRLADRTAARLRAKGLCGRTVTLKVRWSNFKTITRSRSLERDLDTAAEIYGVVRELVAKLVHDGQRIRLLGVAVTGLAPGPPASQLDLFMDRAPRWSEASRAVDSIRDRFGETSVAPATLLSWRPGEP